MPVSPAPRNSNAKLIAGNPNANEMEPAGGVKIFGTNMAEFPIASDPDRGTLT
jgi:hypothetical protein